MHKNRQNAGLEIKTSQAVKNVQKCANETAANSVDNDCTPARKLAILMSELNMERVSLACEVREAEKANRNKRNSAFWCGGMLALSAFSLSCLQDFAIGFATNPALFIVPSVLAGAGVVYCGKQAYAEWMEMWKDSDTEKESLAKAKNLLMTAVERIEKLECFIRDTPELGVRMARKKPISRSEEISAYANIPKLNRTQLALANKMVGDTYSGFNHAIIMACVASANRAD